MQIIKGKLPGAKKVVVYGPEGIGKSTFAAHFPDPVFIDTEGSTKDMDVARFERASSWTMLLDQVRYVWRNPGICKTLIVDTIDWAEQMCVEDLCARNGKKGIEDFGYGNGYVYAKEDFGRFLNLLEDVVQAGINVVLTAHTHIKKFEQPDEMGAYDRWELKLGKKTASQTAPLVKEWADMVLFANYKTWSVAIDDKGQKRKAQGGARVMYTTHNPCWDAKNRYNLPDELPFEYASIAHIIEQQVQNEIQPKVEETVKSTVTEPEKQQPVSQADPSPISQPATEIVKEPDPPINPPEAEKVSAATPPEGMPKNLWDLMQENNVDIWDIENAVIARGYYPPDTPFKNYDPGFVQGVLVGAWPQVLAMIQEIKKNDSIVFN